MSQMIDLTLPLYGAGADASCVPLRAGGGGSRYFAAFTRDGGIH